MSDPEIKCTQLQRLDEMRSADHLSTLEIGDRSGDSQDSIAAAGGEPIAVGRVIQQIVARAIRAAVTLDAAGIKR